MPNKPLRTPEQQEYRDNLAKKLKIIRKFGKKGRELAEILLKKEQSTNKYIQSLGEDRTIEKLLKAGDKDAFIKMIDFGYGEEAFRSLVRHDNFESVELDKDIAEKLIESGLGHFVLEFCDDFKGFDKEIIIKCIDEKRKYDKYDYFERFLGKYDGIIKFDYDIAKHMAKSGIGGLVYGYYKKFDGLTPQNFIELLLDGYKYTEELGRFIDKFEGKFDYETAKLLVDKGVFWILSRNIGKFNGLNKEIAEKLIEKKYSETVLFNLDKFGLKSDEEYKEIIDRILDIDGRIDLCGWKIINDNINIVEKWLDEKLITKLIIKGETSRWMHSRKKLESIIKENNIEINYVDIFEYLIKNHYWAGVSFLTTFECRSKETAKILITENCEEMVIKYIDKFKGLDKEIAEMLIEKGYGDIVAKHPEKFGLKKEK